MSTAIGLVAGLAFAALATPAAAQLAPGALPTLMDLRAVGARPQASPAETLRYGEAPSQIVELFLPKAAAESAKLPVVVIIHGGCWRKDVAGPGLMRAAAGAFLEKGYAVWSVGYRRIDEEGGGWPGTFQDVGAAIDLVRDHAVAHNLDTTRIVGYGHSAGGHLALWAAGRHKLPATSPMKVETPQKLRGVVSVGGLANIKQWERQIDAVCGDDAVALLTKSRAAPVPSVEGQPAEPASSAPDLKAGPALEDRAEQFADTNPAAMLPTGTPVILLHGIYDRISPPAIGLAYAQEARKAGDRAEIQLAPNAGHFEVIAPGSRAFDQAIAAVEKLAR